MSIVRFVINEPLPPTEPEIKNFKERALKELAELDDLNEEILLDKDCPELTDEQLARLMPVYSQRNENFCEVSNG